MLEQEIKGCAAMVERILSETQKRIVGQTHISRRLIMAIIAQGHVLLEGLPGLAKTTAIRTLSEASALSFKRIQFTPDLLPADLIGTQIYDQGSGEFRVRKGPVFAHLVLADEINRAPAKVQSALLEAMEERQVTIGSKSWELEEPFLVMATQNPVEQEGTYPLPEAQLDRFLFKLLVDYPSAEEEELIIRRAAHRESHAIEKVIRKQDLRDMSTLSEKIFVSDKIRSYIVRLIHATRFPEQKGLKDLGGMIETGASPRASISLDRVARINALLEGRTFVTPQDVKDTGHDILRHRLRLTYEAEAENVSQDQVISRIFEQVEVP
ncbi:MAG: AAA family ATPase [Deltaproteobacteria bacterium]|nr:AAA family ATPase [Deltaproteobacteria bacterium]